MTAGPAPQWRVEFDAEVVFSNGGALQAQGFRLDLPSSDIDDEHLGELFVRHLGLLMVGRTTISRKVLLREPHKGSRGVRAASGPRRTVELTGPERPAALIDRAPALRDLVDLPGTVARLTGSGDAEVDRAALAAFDVNGAALLLHTGNGAELTRSAGERLATDGVALLATDSARGGAGGAILAAAGVPVITGLTNLDKLPPTGFRLHAVPLYADAPAPGTAWPVCVYAVVDG
jgi:hypothetical protein